MSKESKEKKNAIADEASENDLDTLSEVAGAGYALQSRKLERITRRRCV